jgi:hypothetical protein
MFSPVKRAMACGAVAVSLIACGAAPAPTSTPVPPISAPATATPQPTVAPTVAPTEAPAATPASARAAGAGFAPAQRSVWETTIGQDEMSGECTQGSVLPAYGLVQITPSEDGLEWKNQEPKPYPMRRVEQNIYAYAGPNSINDGVVTMTVTFSDEKSLLMLREFTPQNDPACTHRHEYTGVFKWFR